MIWMLAESCGPYFIFQCFPRPIQPDAQFIINPGAMQDLRNAFLIGGRVSINF